jgi:hypothetical protein
LMRFMKRSLASGNGRLASLAWSSRYSFCFIRTAFSSRRCWALYFSESYLRWASL